MMAPSTAFVVSFIVCCITTSTRALLFVASLSSPALFLAQPFEIYLPLSSPVKVDGDFLDQTVAKVETDHIAILFHASWCPFSCEAHPIYETLSFMFPEIEHLTIEQSSAMPSVLSRYGIHSFPAILIVNHSSSVRYLGARDLFSLVQSYTKATGSEPVQFRTTDHLLSMSSSVMPYPVISWEVSLREMVTREPYLAFSIFFIFSRVLYFILPGALGCAKSLWHMFVIPQMNLEIFGEMSQIFGRALHMIDVKNFWTKLKQCKTRNFQRRARSARVWASSIASVSVGDN